MQPSHLYIGTLSRAGSRGIYATDFDPSTGALSQPTLVAETKDPSFLAFSPDQRCLYAVSASEELAAGFAVDRATGQLTPLQAPRPANGVAPCHLAIDSTGRTLLVAHYHEGFVAALPIRTDGSPGAPATVIRYACSGANPAGNSSPLIHSVTISPDNRHVIVCALGLDRVFTYRLDPATAKLTAAEPPFVATPPGSGPRHFKFSPDGRHAFVISQTGSTLASYSYNAVTGALTELDTQSMLPASFEGVSLGAEVRVHPNGRFVYGSNRGHDSIAVFGFEPATAKLSLVEIKPTGGRTPRNFAFSPDGRWLVAANQDSNSLTTFRVDPATGRLTRAEGSASVPTPVCVLFSR